MVRPSWRLWTSLLQIRDSPSPVFSMLYALSEACTQLTYHNHPFFLELPNTLVRVSLFDLTVDMSNMVPQRADSSLQ